MTKSVLALTIALTMLSCKSKKIAFNYNQEIVAMEKELEPAIKSTENNVGRYVTAGRYDSIAVAGKLMQDIIQEIIDKIEKQDAPDAKEGENFKLASLKYFKFIRGLYTEYIKLGNAKTDDEKGLVLQDIKKIVDEKNKIIVEMQTAQRKYADANGFKVQ
jgi:hypothetical protein